MYGKAIPRQDGYKAKNMAKYKTKNRCNNKKKEKQHQQQQKRKNAWNLYGKAVPRQDDSLILGRLDGHALGRGGEKVRNSSNFARKEKIATS